MVIWTRFFLHSLGFMLSAGGVVPSLETITGSLVDDLHYSCTPGRCPASQNRSKFQWLASYSMLLASSFLPRLLDVRLARDNY